MEKAVVNGVTAFEDFSKYFKDNYDVLVADFVA